MVSDSPYRTPEEMDAKTTPKDYAVCNCGEVMLRKGWVRHWPMCAVGGKKREATEPDKQQVIAYVRYFHGRHGFMPPP